MANEVWLPLNSEERTLLRAALAAYAMNGDKDSVVTLSKKIVGCQPHPDITVRASGGVIQGIIGNPFPIRVCDYDEDEDMDEDGERCGIWFEPPDPNWDDYGATPIRTSGTAGTPRPSRTRL